MALATNTTQGEIQLAGDLAGDGTTQTGSSPQLTHIAGLTPGSYNAAKITVDSKGRVILASTPTASEIADLLPGASTSTIGAVMLGDNIYKTTSPSAGYQAVNFGGSVVGSNNTGLANQSCATYSVTINVDNSGDQVVSAAGSSLQTFNDVVSVINAQTTGCTASINGGNIRVTSDTTGKLSTVSITNDKMFGCMTGYGSISTAVDGEDTCEIYVPAATDTVKGVVKIGSGITVTDGVISFDIGSADVATASTLGVVKVPTSNGLSIDGSGTVSVALATESTKGVMQVGTGLDVTAGVVSVDLSELSLPDATESTKGVMQVGTGLDVTAGVVSVDLSEVLTDATTSTKGVVQVGTNIDVSSGVISVATATTSTKGVVQVGAGLAVTAGVVSVDVNTLPKASESTLGVMQVGTGLDVDVNGVVSVDVSEITITNATTSTKGIVQIGTNIDVSSGVISVATATTSTKGVVQVGTNIDVTAGVISVPDATTSIKGVVSIQSGTGLSVSSGVLSGTNASNVVKGVVASADTTNISITSGYIDVGSNIPKKDSVNTYTKSNTVSPSTLTSATTVSVDAALSNNFNLTLTTNGTLANPTNGVSGQTLTFVIKQDGTGGRTLAFGSNYKFKGGVIPTVTSTANAVDVMCCVFDGTSYFCFYNKDFV